MRELIDIKNRYHLKLVNGPVPETKKMFEDLVGFMMMCTCGDGDDMDAELGPLTDGTHFITETENINKQHMIETFIFNGKRYAAVYLYDFYDNTEYRHVITMDQDGLYITNETYTFDNIVKLVSSFTDGYDWCHWTEYD